MAVGLGTNGRPFQLIFFNTDAKFKSNAYWNNQYVTALYGETDFGRPSFSVFKEIEEDELKVQTIQYQNKTTEVNFTLMLMRPVLDVLTSIELHNDISIRFLDTGELFKLENVRAEDDGDRTDNMASVTIFAQLEPVLDSCDDGRYSLAE